MLYQYCLPLSSQILCGLAASLPTCFLLFKELLLLFWYFIGCFNFGLPVDFLPCLSSILYFFSIMLKSTLSALLCYSLCDASSYILICLPAALLLRYFNTMMVYLQLFIFAIVNLMKSALPFLFHLSDVRYIYE